MKKPLIKRHHLNNQQLVHLHQYQPKITHQPNQTHLKKQSQKNTNNKSPKQTDTRQKNANRVSVLRGPKDSLKLQNKFGGLEDESMELSVEIPQSSTSNMSLDNTSPTSSNNIGRRSPVLPP